MAQPATNPKIEELRFRLKADPKSRLFFPLAEELRKAGQVEEAEQVLRSGLVAHSTYLSAWVSLGRVLRDQKKDGEAVDALSRALQLDPGNVVAARLLGDAHLSLGDKVEAIKKYKLVHALMPSDEELQATIASLDRDLNPPAAVPEPEPPPPAPEPLPEPLEESPFDRTMPPFEVREEEATGDAEPMYAAHEESPFEEPVADYTAASMTVEAPAGMHIEELPPAEGSNPKIARLEGWLSKVARKEGPNV
jgi:tetratricopeptide (TPR) repeat protein